MKVVAKGEGSADIWKVCEQRNYTEDKISHG